MAKHHPAPGAAGSPGREAGDEDGLQGNRVARATTGSRIVEAVMQRAVDEGLTTAKDGRISGRVSSELIAKAKARTGLQSDTDLVEFALATVALDDDFARGFREVKGTVDPALDLGF